MYSATPPFFLKAATICSDSTWGTRGSLAPCRIRSGVRIRSARCRGESNRGTRLAVEVDKAQGGELPVRVTHHPEREVVRREADGVVRCFSLVRRQVDRGAGGEVEFATLTLFESMDAVRAFAGADFEIAVVPPEARELLCRFDGRSVHYETILEPK